MKQLDEATSKKNAEQAAEEIDTLGQESEEKAVKWVQEVEQREEKKRQNIEDQQAEVLTHKRKFKKNDYYEALLREAQTKLAEYDIPHGYQVAAELGKREDGTIIFGCRRIGYRWYAKGMKICGEPLYDRNCVQRMVVQTMLALDELEGEHSKHRTKSGIILPSH